MEVSRGRRMWAVCRHESVGAYDGIELGMDFPLDFGVHGHGEGKFPRRAVRKKGERMRYGGRRIESFLLQ